LQKEAMKILDQIEELVSGIEIVLSPALLGLLAGLGIYYFKQHKIGLILSFLISILGLAIGIIWAIRIHKKKGATNFMTKVSAPAELNKENEEA
jgi:hypothetical protein